MFSFFLFLFVGVLASLRILNWLQPYLQMLYSYTLMKLWVVDFPTLSPLPSEFLRLPCNDGKYWWWIRLFLFLSVRLLTFECAVKAHGRMSSYSKLHKWWWHYLWRNDKRNLKESAWERTEETSGTAHTEWEKKPSTGANLFEKCL